MNLFLQAAYKVVDIPVHSCYDIGKDYFMPVVGSVLAFLFAYLIMWFQNRNAVNVEKEKEAIVKSHMKSFTQLYLNKALTEIDINYTMASAFLSNYKFEKPHEVKTYKFTNSSVETLLEIDSTRLYSAFEEYMITSKFRENYVEFTVTLRKINSILNYFNTLNEKFLQDKQDSANNIKNLYDKYLTKVLELLSSKNLNNENYLLRKDGLLISKMDDYNIFLRSRNTSKSASYFLLSIMRELINSMRNRESITEEDNYILQNYIVELQMLLLNEQIFYSYYNKNCDEISLKLNNYKIKLLTFKVAIES